MNIKDYLCVNHHFLLAIALLVKSKNVYIFITIDYQSFIFQNSKVVGLLGETLDIFIPLVIQIEIFIPQTQELNSTHAELQNYT